MLRESFARKGTCGQLLVAQGCSSFPKETLPEIKATRSWGVYRKGVCAGGAISRIRGGARVSSGGMEMLQSVNPGEGSRLAPKFELILDGEDVGSFYDQVSTALGSVWALISGVAKRRTAHSEF